VHSTLNTLKKVQDNHSKCYVFNSSALLHLFFSSNSEVFVDRGRKNISCPRAQGTLAMPLNKVRSTLETHSMNATKVGESNKAGVWGRNPQPPEANWVSVVDLPSVYYFCYFLEEIKYVQR